MNEKIIEYDKRMGVPKFEEWEFEGISFSTYPTDWKPLTPPPKQKEG